jgi:hypothetical protein
VLLGQGYSMSQGAMINGYGAMVEWWLAAKNQGTLKKKHLQRHYFHHESYLKLPGNNSNPRVNPRVNLYNS